MNGRLSRLVFLACLAATASAQILAPDSRTPLPVGIAASPMDSIVVCVPYRSGWNLVSTPVSRAPGTDSIWQVFCGQGSCFNRETYPQCTAPVGMGLWIRVVNHPTTCCIEGGAVTQESVHVAQGWNMIGVISSPVAASSVTSSPPGILRSGFFGYTDRYFIAETLEPGFGYWVRVSREGFIVLHAEGMRK